VDRESNPLFQQVIEEFTRITGVRFHPLTPRLNECPNHGNE
jgi:hypothetical protein